MGIYQRFKPLTITYICFFSKMTTKTGFCLLIILTTVWITNGFSTRKCNHNQLSDQVGQFTSCLNSELSDLVDQLLKNYKDQLTANNNSYDLKKGCPVLQKHADNVKECAVSLTSSCLDDKATDLVKHAFNGAGIVCENLQHLIIPEDISQQPKELRNWGDELGRQLNRWDSNPLAAFESILKPDKKCDERMIESAFQKIYTCAVPNMNTIYGNIVNVISYGQVTQRFTICSSLDNLFESCAVESECISSQEMELIKKVVWKIYPTFMNAAVKIKESFGGSNKAVDEISQTSFMHGNQTLFGPFASQMREEDKTKYGMITDQVINDFEGKRCKRIVAENSGTNQTYPNQNGANMVSSFDIGSFIGGMVLVVIFNVICVFGVRYYKKRELQLNYNFLPWGEGNP